MIKRSLLILFFAYAFNGCEISDTRLKIRNQASYPIYYLYSQGLTLNNLEKIDLLKNPSNKLSDTSYANYVLPNSTATIATYNIRWNNYIKETVGEKVTFFFFSADTLKKYTWEEIVRGNRYSQKKIYTLEELENSNWVINYPVKKK